MIDTIIARVKGFLLNPVETFQESGNDEPRLVFTYFGALLLFNAILSALIAAVLGIGSTQQFTGTTTGIAVLFMTFFMVLLGGFVFMFIFAAWIHLWVYLLGGRNGIMETIKAMMYGNTPLLILGWIPFISIIFALWSLVLGVLGIRELQGLSTGRTIIAVGIAIIIPFILIIILAAWLTVSEMTVTAV